MTVNEAYIEELYRDHADDVRAFLISKTQDHSLLDDIIQDAYLKLLSTIVNGKEVRNPKSWLMRVAHNMLIDTFRNEKKRQSAIHHSNAESKDSISDDSSPGHTPADCLKGIIANLPPKYKRAVYMTDIQGVKQVDAAAQLGLTLPTFKSHVQRGRLLVKQGYVDCCDYTIDEDGILRGEIKNRESCKVCQ